MTDTPSYLKEMSRMVEPAPTMEAESSRREAMIAHINRAAKSTREQHRASKSWRRRGAIAALPLAAGILMGLWFVRQEPASMEETGVAARASIEEKVASSGSPKQEKQRGSLISGPMFQGGSDAIAPGEALGAGQLRVGPSASAFLHLASGARVEAMKNSKMLLRTDQEGTHQREVLALASGVVALNVPALDKWRLLVETPEAVVEVRGTRFEVQRVGDVTSVSVSEGLVSVRAGEAEVFLNPGDTWRSGGRASDEEPRGQGVTRKKEKGKPTQSAVMQREETTPSSESVASDLAEQNRLYQSAIAARQSGFDDLARVRFRDLLSRYPDSPLASAAHEELARLDGKEK